MTYHLGIDVGTTFTAAAVWRDGHARVANLGQRAPVVPSVVYVGRDGGILVGEAAEQRAVSEPHHVAREFKRRIGDPTPLIVGGSPHSADGLTARVFRWVAATVQAVEGTPAASIAVAHPANWGPFKLDLLHQAVRRAGLAHATTLTEPEAAALNYAAQQRVHPGAKVAVYDLGGGTFDAAVLAKTEDGWFQILGEPQGIDRLGGVDFDEAVFRHVARSLDGLLDRLDPDDPDVAAQVARLRRDCVAAKEVLSSDTDTAIPVILPGVQTTVRLTRSELEGMIRPAVAESVEALGQAVTAAGVSPEDLEAVLLVGGSSRLPLVGQMVGAALGRPVAIDAHPKHGVALGAAFTAAERASAASRVDVLAGSAGAAPPSSRPLTPWQPSQAAPSLSPSPPPSAPSPLPLASGPPAGPFLPPRHEAPAALDVDAGHPVDAPALVASVLLGAMATVLVLASVRFLQLAAVLAGFWDGEQERWADIGVVSDTYRQRLESAVETMSIPVTIAFLGVPVVGLFFVIWQFRLARETQRRWGNPGFGAGWAIGGWLIPAAGLVVVAVQLARVSGLAAARSRQPGSGNSQLVAGWAGTFGLGSVLLGVGLSLNPSSWYGLGYGDDLSQRTQEALLGQRLSALACALLAISALLAVMMIRSLTRQLRQARLGGD